MDTTDTTIQGMTEAEEVKLRTEIQRLTLGLNEVIDVVEGSSKKASDAMNVSLQNATAATDAIENEVEVFENENGPKIEASVLSELTVDELESLVVAE